MNDNDFERLYSDVQEIKQALLGDDRYGQQGYRQRIEVLEKRHRELDIKTRALSSNLDKIYHITFGITATTSAFITGLMLIITFWDQLF